MQVRDVMTANPDTLSPHDTAVDAIHMMRSRNYRHLPVVNGHQEPVGVLSVKKIVRYLVEHFPSVVYNQPPRADVANTAEGA